MNMNSDQTIINVSLCFIGLVCIYVVLAQNTHLEFFDKLVSIHEVGANLTVVSRRPVEFYQADNFDVDWSKGAEDEEEGEGGNVNDDASSRSSKTAWTHEPHWYRAQL